MQKQAWNIDCEECLEQTNVECNVDVQPPVACPMCGCGSVEVVEDASEQDE
ncbi:hypothetical protein MYOV003v1_p0196 [Vibrio phage 207E48.1]|nr:hypothetical protein MYOV003v1_p0196 [Vibrio phage 207E48.1]